MSRDVEIVERIYNYVTGTLGVKDVSVGFGGWYVFVFCKNPQDEQFLQKNLSDGFDGIGVVVKNKN